MFKKILFCGIALLLIQNICYAKYDLKEIERQVKYYSSLLKHKNTSKRLEAVKELAKIKHKKTVEPLTQALNDSNVFIRKNAIIALGDLPYRKVASHIVNRLKKEKNIFVLREGIISLGKLKDQSGKRFLEKMTKHKTIMIRSEAKKSLELLSQR